MIRISLNDRDITSSIISASISDFDGDNIDTLSIELLHSQKIAFNDKLKVTAGQNLLGVFYVSDITEHYKKYISINAHAIKINLKTKESKTYKGAISDIIKTIASNHDLRYKIKFKNENLKIHYQAFDKSPLDTLNQIAKKYNASFAIKNSMIFFTDKSADARLHYKIKASDCIDLRITHTNKTDYKSIKASYHNMQTNQREEITIGEGEPVLYRYYIKARNKDEAVIRAQESLKKSSHKSLTGTLAIKGQPIYAGGALSLELEGRVIKAIISKVNHDISAQGWKISLEFEA